MACEGTEDERQSEDDKEKGVKKEEERKPGEGRSGE